MTNFEIIQLMREMNARKLKISDPLGEISVTQEQKWSHNAPDVYIFTIYRPTDGKTVIEVAL